MGKNCIQGLKNNGDCCLTNLSFLENVDINISTDVFIVLDPSGSFNTARDYITQEINTWYADFRITNPDHSGNVYFYKGAKSDVVGTTEQINPVQPLIGTPTDSILVEDETLPLVSNVKPDGYNTNLGYTANEGWLSYPGIIRNLSSEFTGLGYSDPKDVLFIYLGDESSFRGAYYHGCKEVTASGVSGNCASTGVINGIQTTVLSESTYNTGYKEDYDSFVNTHFSQFSFFKGIVYGLTLDTEPWNDTGSTDSGLPAFHSHIYQAIEPSTVSESDFVESSYATNSLGDPTGFSLDFIKTTNYLADAGYAGLKNYGWKEFHDVGYGDISESFTSEIFKLNVEKALTTPTKVTLKATLADGTEVTSGELDLTSGLIKVTEKDTNPGFLSAKLIAGDNITIANNSDNSLTINAISNGTDLGDFIFTVEVTDDYAQNWQNLVATYATAKTFGSTIGGYYYDQRGTVLVPSGVFSAGSDVLELDTEYLDIIGLNYPTFECTTSTPSEGILQINVSNIRISALKSHINSSTSFISFNESVGNIELSNLRIYSGNYGIIGNAKSISDSMFKDIEFRIKTNGLISKGIFGLSFTNNSEIINCITDKASDTKHLFESGALRGTTIMRDCSGNIYNSVVEATVKIINHIAHSVGAGSVGGIIMNSEIDLLSDMATTTKLYNVISETIDAPAGGIPLFATNTIVGKDTAPALYSGNTLS